MTWSGEMTGKEGCFQSESFNLPIFQPEMVCFLRMFCKCLILNFPGAVDCARWPPQVEIAVARAELCGNVPFDAGFAAMLEEIIHENGAIFPPPSIPEADILYIHLRNAVRAQL